MQIFINIIFVLAFIYWIYFLFTSRKGEKGIKIGYYSSTAAIILFVIGIISIDVYSNINYVSIDNFKLWLNTLYKLVIVTISITTFILNKYMSS